MNREEILDDEILEQYCVTVYNLYKNLEMMAGVCTRALDARPITRTTKDRHGGVVLDTQVVQDSYVFQYTSDFGIKVFVMRDGADVLTEVYEMDLKTLDSKLEGNDEQEKED